MNGSPREDVEIVEGISLDAAALEGLFAEIRRYLDAVETFRREGREPHWSSVPLPEEVRP